MVETIDPVKRRLNTRTDGGGKESKSVKDLDRIIPSSFRTQNLSERLTLTRFFTTTVSAAE